MPRNTTIGTFALMSLAALAPASQARAAPGAAAAAESGAWTAPPLPQDVPLHWVTATGKVLAPQWVVKSSWVWPDAAQGGPVLRAWVQISETARVVEAPGVDAHPSDSPIQDVDRKQVFSVDLSGEQASVKLMLPGKKIATELSLVATPRSHALLVDASCSDRGIQFRTVKTVPGAAEPMTVGASCVEREKTIELTLHAIGGDIDRTTLKKAPGKPAAPVPAPSASAKALPKKFTYLIAKPADEKAARIGLFTLKPRGAAGPSSEQLVHYVPSEARRRWGVGAGLGVSSLSYREPDIGISTSQIAVTAKIDARYALLPDKIDLSANAFSNILILKGPAGDVPSARYLGINGRVGYQLPWRIPGFVLQASAGFYFWSMSVESDRYGIKHLYGPQVFLVARAPNGAKRRYAIYAKFAPIYDGLKIYPLLGRELATGGSVQIATLKQTFPLSVTLDMASFSVGPATGFSEAGLFSLSGGLQITY